MKTIFQNVIILSLVAFTFGACKKKVTYQAYSFNATSSVEGGDVSFNGNANTGSDPVLDCGVILASSSGATIDNALQKVSLGQISTTPTNAFFTTFAHLPLNTTYYLKGYVKDDKGYTYSNEQIQTTHCMTVDSIIPKTTITSSTNFVIWGKNFGTVASNIVVTFGNDQGTVFQTATPTSINNNFLNVNIPSGFVSGDKVEFNVHRTDAGCNYIYYALLYNVTYQQ